MNRYPNRPMINRTMGNVKTNRNPNHATLKMMLIKPLSPLLDAYKNSLLKIDSPQEHYDVLYSYYESHNILTQLLTTLAIIEIRTTNTANPLFRGNTAFSKFYTTYVNTKCNKFINETSQKLIEMMTEMNYNDKESMSDTQYYQIIQKYFILIDNSFNSIPIELLWLLHNIYKEVETKRGIKEAILSINTLFFMRYLYIPFKNMPNLFKYIQSQITPLLFVVPNLSKTSVVMTNTTLKDAVNKNEMKKDEKENKNPEQIIIDLIDFILNNISLMKPPKINQNQIRSLEDNSIDDKLLQIIQKNKENILEWYDGDENDLTPFFVEYKENNKTPRSRWN